MQIEQLIGQLLMRHACVVVPGFGGFISSHRSALIDKKAGIISPPSKRILFNKQLVNNDGLLLNAIAQERSLSYQEAEGMLNEIISKWWSELNQGRQITLEQVGTFHLDNENNVQFVQDRFFNLLLDSFGMGQVKFIPEVAIEVENNLVLTTKFEQNRDIVLQKTAEKENVALEVETTTPIISMHKPRRKIMRYVAAACILPLAFYSFWIPSKTDVLESGLLSFHDLNPFYKSAKQQYQETAFTFQIKAVEKQRSLTELIEQIPSDAEIFPLEIEDEDGNVELFYVRVGTSNQSINVTTEETISTNEVHSKASYSVVVGSFADPSNASQLVQNLKNRNFNDAESSMHNGMTRVFAGTYRNLEEAKSIVEQLKSQGISAWVLN